MIDNTGSPERKEKSSATQRQILHYGQQHWQLNLEAQCGSFFIWNGSLHHSKAEHALSGSVPRKLHREPGFAEKQQVMTFGLRT